MNPLRADLKTLDEFRVFLGTAVERAAQAVADLSHTDRPKLGGFADAVLVADTHQKVHSDYLQRLQSLVWELVAIRTGNDEALGAYRAETEVATGDLARVVGEDRRRARFRSEEPGATR